MSISSSIKSMIFDVRSNTWMYVCNMMNEVTKKVLIIRSCQSSHWFKCSLIDTYFTRPCWNFNYCHSYIENCCTQIYPRLGIKPKFNHIISDLLSLQVGDNLCINLWNKIYQTSYYYSGILFHHNIFSLLFSTTSHNIQIMIHK